jgi:hypothetical protein
VGRKTREGRTVSELVLEGIDGANPLGFLSAIGTLIVVNDLWPEKVFLGWIKDYKYKPVIRVTNIGLSEEQTSLPERQKAFSKIIVESLKVPAKTPPGEAMDCMAELFKEFNRRRKLLEEKKKQIKEKIKGLNLRGRENGLKDDILKHWIEEQVAELIATAEKDEQDLQTLRKFWLEMVEITSPSEELCLGKTLSVKKNEYRTAALRMLSDCDNYHRRNVDFLSSFGVESIEDKGLIRCTPFCFVTGSGHQYFLETITNLMRQVDSTRIEQCLFHQWCYEDERMSLRWAPIEDRRYSLMWGDPGGEVAMTVWAANLLAYHGLRFFPLADIQGKLHLPGFIEGKRKDLHFRWPIWKGFLGPETVRSLLAHRSLRTFEPNQNDKDHLYRIGVTDVFNSERLRVGNPPLEKINFSIAYPL